MGVRSATERTNKGGAGAATPQDHRCRPETFVAAEFLIYEPRQVGRADGARAFDWCWEPTRFFAECAKFQLPDNVGDPAWALMNRPPITPAPRARDFPLRQWFHVEDPAASGPRTRQGSFKSHHAPADGTGPGLSPICPSAEKSFGELIGWAFRAPPPADDLVFYRTTCSKNSNCSLG